MSNTKRLRALDAFRGLTIAGMILVNTPGSWTYVYPPLRHAEWVGCTPTDLVFPFFLFIVGTAMWYSFKKFDHQLTGKAFGKIAKRSALIFLIGLALNAFPFYDMEIGSLRIMGVLQRIAVAFFFGAIICAGVSLKRLPFALLAILFGYWAILAFGAETDPYSLEQNVARTVDLAIFGEAHVYGGFGIPFDPEGLLSSIPAVGTVILGYMLGSYIDRSSLQPPALRNMLLAGGALILSGWTLGYAFPIIKGLWTSSYVLYTAGIATLVLTLFLWLIDMKGWSKWAQPFVVFGMNPLFIYALSVLFVKIMFRISLPAGDGQMNMYQWIYEMVCVPIAGNMNGSLLFALSYVALHWLIALILYRRQIFIKV